MTFYALDATRVPPSKEVRLYEVRNEDCYLCAVTSELHPYTNGRAGLREHLSERSTRAPDGCGVSPFDFPMIDNVRLGDGGRVSMVMTRVDDGGISLALVYFPDTRTSLKDRPFHDEVLRALEQ